LLVLAGGLLSCIPLRGVAAQGSFRTSLTVTISRLAPDGGSTAPDSLGCRQLTLHWRKLDGAQRYAVYVSTTGGEPWVELPPSNACGPRESDGPTSVSSSEPTTGAPRTRKVYYKVVAVTGGGSSEKTLDTTEVVSVELR
jgi:hypothetical protein